MAPPPRPTPQNNVEGVVVARSEICSWEARNQFRDQHCLWKGGPANAKSSFSGGHTVKLTSSFPNGATTPTKTMLKVLSLRDRKMFLAKRGTDFAPSFVWVCMVEGGPAHPKLSFGGGCRCSRTGWSARELHYSALPSCSCHRGIFICMHVLCSDLWSRQDKKLSHRLILHASVRF